MALKLLAGPFAVKTSEGHYGSFFKRPMWSDNLQAFVGALSYTANGRLYIDAGFMTQLDGVATLRNDASSVYYTFFHDLGRNCMAVASSYSSGYVASEVNWINLLPYGEALPESLQQCFGNALYLADRIIQLRAGGDVYWRNFTSGAETFECTVSGISTGSVWSPGPDKERTAFVADKDGAVLYDYIDKQVVGWPRRLGWTSTHPMVYSPALGVWFAFSKGVTPASHDRIWIYADTPEPANLSAPAAQSAVKSGKGVTFKTRLTGSAGEPCPGHHVEWAVTAPGEVAVPQSTTNTDGYAETVIMLPPDSAGQSVTVTAEVIF